MPLRLTSKQGMLTDGDMLFMLGGNFSRSWDSLYDQYAAMMYGAILRMVDNSILAEEILIECFTLLKRDPGLIHGGKQPLSLFLLHHTYKTAIHILRANEMSPKQESSPVDLFPILNSLMFRPHSLKETAEKYEISQDEARKMLHNEFGQIRSELGK